MTDTPVASGQTANNQTVTSGNELEVQSGGAANATTVQSGGTLQVDVGGTETNATIQAGGLETVQGTINSSNAVSASGTASGDTDYGTINVGSGGVINNVTVENGATLNLTAKSAYANGATILSGGTLTINGNAPANNVTLQGGTLELQSPKADSTNATTGVPSASGSLTFANGYASKLQIDVAQTGANGTTFAQTIAGFNTGDVIDLQSATYAGASLATTQSGANTILTVTGGGSSGAETFNFANTTAADFKIAPDNASTPGTEVLYTVCFRAGTRILTARGEVAVEALKVGDLAVTASGTLRPIRWLGCKDLTCTPDTWPVRISAGAFGPSVPERDVFLSPGHPVLIGADAQSEGGTLVPIMCLINGTTVARAPAAHVSYWHVELDEHDILLAEGLAAESFFDLGCRPWFDGDEDHVLVNPDLVAPGLVGRCRPVALDGALVEAERRRLDMVFATALAGPCEWPDVDTSRINGTSCSA